MERIWILTALMACRLGIGAVTANAQGGEENGANRFAMLATNEGNFTVEICEVKGP